MDQTAAFFAFNNKNAAATRGLDPWFLMFTRFLVTVPIGTVTISSVRVIVSVFFFVAMLRLPIIFTIRAMITVWFVCLRQRPCLMNHRRTTAS